MSSGPPAWAPRDEPVVGGFADLLDDEGRPRVPEQLPPPERDGHGRFVGGARPSRPPRPRAPQDPDRFTPGVGPAEQTGSYDLGELFRRLEETDRRPAQSKAWPVAITVSFIIAVLAATVCVLAGLYFAHGGTF